MGFNKRWVTKENLMIRYKDGGIESVKTYFKADALIMSDELCTEVLRLLNENDEVGAIKLLDNEAL